MENVTVGRNFDKKNVLTNLIIIVLSLIELSVTLYFQIFSGQRGGLILFYLSIAGGLLLYILFPLYIYIFLFVTTIGFVVKSFKEEQGKKWTFFIAFTILSIVLFALPYIL